MKARKPLLYSYSQLIWYTAFLAIVLGLGFLTGCASRPALVPTLVEVDRTQMECRSEGLIWNGGQCYRPSGAAEVRQ